MGSLYGRGGRPAPLPRGPLPRNPGNPGNIPENSNTNQATDTKESPEGAPQTSNTQQAPSNEASPPQPSTSAPHPLHPAPHPNPPQSSVPNPPKTLTKNQETLTHVLHHLNKYLRKHKTPPLPPLSACPSLHFSTHTNTPPSPTHRFLSQRLHLGTATYLSSTCPVYLYLLDGRPKPIVELEFLNPLDNSLTRIPLSETQVWNDVELVDPIRRSRQNIKEGSRNWLPYEMLAKYYLVRRYEELGEIDVEVGKGEWVFEGGFGRYLGTARNNYFKGVGGEESQGRGRGREKDREEEEEEEEEEEREGLKGDVSFSDDEEEGEGDRESDGDYVPEGTRNQLRSQPRRSTRGKSGGGGGGVVEAQADEVIPPTREMYYERRGGISQLYDGAGDARETSLDAFLRRRPANLSIPQLRRLATLANEEVARRESDHGTRPPPSGVATGRPEAGHTFMHAATQGQFASPSGFQEAGPRLARGYVDDGPLERHPDFSQDYDQTLGRGPHPGFPPDYEHDQPGPF